MSAEDKREIRTLSDDIADGEAQRHQLEDRIMDLEVTVEQLDERHERWDVRVRAMVHAVDNQGLVNRLKIGTPDRFVHAWMDCLLKEGDEQ